MAAIEGEYATHALNHFHNGNYNECIANLEQLSAYVKQNRKIAFNKAVAEFYQSSCTNITIFQKELISLTGQKWPIIDTEEIKSSADVPIYYSCAVVLYHTSHFFQARNVLEKLITFRDKLLDSELECSVVLLLMEVYLCCRMPDKAIYVSEQSGKIFQNQSNEFRDQFKKTNLRAYLMNKSQLTPPTNIQSMEWLFLHAHQQYVNGDILSAIATLGQYHQFLDGSFNIKNPDELWAPLNNNLSVLYSALKKHNLSVRYMQQTLKEYSKFIKKIKSENNLKNEVSIPLRDRPIYIFNFGISLLKANRPEDAFECLIEAVRHFPNNPRIWLRLAECCVFHNKKTNYQDNSVQKIGTGPHVKLLLNTANKDKYSISGESYAIPTLSLEFAALCLMNAIILLPYKEPSNDYFSHSLFNVNPSDPLNLNQYNDLRNSALLLYSYVSLRLNDPITALDNCMIILSHPGSLTQCALSHMYAAEALIALDRIIEAIEHISPKTMQIYTNELSRTSGQIIGVAAWVNRAICHTIMGDLEMAHSLLHQVNSLCTYPPQLYLELCAGNIENCQNLIRKFSRINLS